jgi:hypothetical protein
MPSVRLASPEAVLPGDDVAERPGDDLAERPGDDLAEKKRVGNKRAGSIAQQNGKRVKSKQRDATPHARAAADCSQHAPPRSASRDSAAEPDRVRGSGCSASPPRSPAHSQAHELQAGFFDDNIVRLRGAGPAGPDLREQIRRRQQAAGGGDGLQRNGPGPAGGEPGAAGPAERGGFLRLSGAAAQDSPAPASMQHTGRPGGAFLRDVAGTIGLRSVRSRSPGRQGEPPRLPRTASDQAQQPAAPGDTRRHTFPANGRPGGFLAGRAPMQFPELRGLLSAPRSPPRVATAQRSLARSLAPPAASPPRHGSWPDSKRRRSPSPSPAPAARSGDRAWREPSVDTPRWSGRQASTPSPDDALPVARAAGAPAARAPPTRAAPPRAASGGFSSDSDTPNTPSTPRHRRLRRDTSPSPADARAAASAGVGAHARSSDLEGRNNLARTQSHERPAGFLRPAQQPAVRSAISTAPPAAVRGAMSGQDVARLVSEQLAVVPGLTAAVRATLQEQLSTALAGCANLDISALDLGGLIAKQVAVALPPAAQVNAQHGPHQAERHSAQRASSSLNEHDDDRPGGAGHAPRDNARSRRTARRSHFAQDLSRRQSPPDGSPRVRSASAARTRTRTRSPEGGDGDMRPRSPDRSRRRPTREELQAAQREREAARWRGAHGIVVVSDDEAEAMRPGDDVDDTAPAQEPVTGQGSMELGGAGVAVGGGYAAGAAAASAPAAQQSGFVKKVDIFASKHSVEPGASKRSVEPGAAAPARRSHEKGAGMGDLLVKMLEEAHGMKLEDVVAAKVRGGDFCASVRCAF